MSIDLNLCQFIGRLGNDPEIRYAGDGKAIASLSIACSDDYKDKSGQNVEQTNWIRVVAFGRLAEIMGEYLKKGSQVHISGKQVTRKWQNKEGVDQYTTEIKADKMQMLGGQGESSHQAAAKPQSQAQPKQMQPAPSNEFDDDIPF